MSAADEKRIPNVPMATVQHVAALLGCPTTQMVPYYPNGDRNGDPMIAVVRKNHSGGVVDLTVFPQGQPMVRNDIKHADDPSFLTNPRLAREYGVWDYPPGYVPEKFLKMPVEVPAVAPSVIREWCNGCADYQRIASRCGGISVELVTEIMGRYGVVHKS